ncbi:isochorismatase family protein [Escherichia coli]|uniref:isochorismatase family protein n=1 Tax=Escherichia coli TaxID=562 RepID=UPI001F0F3845|nr:isochorismatase family protein [Escherichia coli]UMS05978.1 isochorismatase [Escherichia coli]
MRLSYIVMSGALLLAGNSLVSAQTVNLPPSAEKTYATDEGFLTPLSRKDTVLLLVDQQVGLYSGVRDIPLRELKHNVVALVRAAKAMDIPIVVTETMPDGMWGPIIPELQNELEGVSVIQRTKVNAWDDLKVRNAIEKTGRKQILIAGVSLEVCAAFPALAAKRDGYDTRVVLDASGTFSNAKRTSGLSRLQGAGIPVVDYATAGIEWLGDNAAPAAGKLYTALDMPNAVLVGQMYQGQHH